LTNTNPFTSFAANPVKLPKNTVIAPEKLTRYLLVFKKRNDKSQWLAEAGYYKKLANIGKW
jgi:hypothetical protein